MKHPDEHAFRQRMGGHVRALRLARGHTQERFAEFCGLSSDTVRRLELGSFSPSVATVRAVVGGLGITLGTFFDSLESGERMVEREITDLLADRSPDERLMALRVVLALFGHDAGSVPQGGAIPAEQRREPTTDGGGDPRERIEAGVVLPREDGE